VVLLVSSLALLQGLVLDPSLLLPDMAAVPVDAAV